jgi:hypothetical protein
MWLAKSTMVVNHELGRRNNQGSLPFSWGAMCSINGFGLLKSVRQPHRSAVLLFFADRNVVARHEAIHQASVADLNPLIFLASPH